MSDDLVKRLRDVSFSEDNDALCHEAADRIEQDLKNERMLVNQLPKLKDRIEALTDQAVWLSHKLAKANYRIEALESALKDIADNSADRDAALRARRALDGKP